MLRPEPIGAHESSQAVSNGSCAELSMATAQNLGTKLARYAEIFQSQIQAFSLLCSSLDEVVTTEDLSGALGRFDVAIKANGSLCSLFERPSPLTLSPVQFETLAEAAKAIVKGDVLVATVADSRVNDLVTRLVLESAQGQMQKGFPPLRLRNQNIAAISDIVGDQDKHFDRALKELAAPIVGSLPLPSRNLEANCTVTFMDNLTKRASVPLPIHFDDFMLNYGRDSGFESSDFIGRSALNLLFIRSNSEQAGTPIFLCDSCAQHEVAMKHEYSARFNHAQLEFLNCYNKFLRVLRAIEVDQDLENKHQSPHQHREQLFLLARQYIDNQRHSLDELGYREYLGPINTPLLLKGGPKGAFHMGGSHERAHFSLFVSVVNRET